MNQDDLRNNLLDSGHWLRILFMLCFAFAAWVVSLLLAVLVLVQLLIALVSGNANPNLQKTGYQFVRYLQQILQFLLYNREEKPFPFADFPSAEGFEPPQRPARPAPAAAASDVQQAAEPEPEPELEPESQAQPEAGQTHSPDDAGAADGQGGDQERMP